MKKVTKEVLQESANKLLINLKKFVYLFKKYESKYLPTLLQKYF